MCGISGIIEKKRLSVSAYDLQVMTERVAHRGPDGQDLYVNGRVGLGHRRLAILDTSNNGLQPMHYPSAGLTIVYNGEIYNYLELREELIGQGCVFFTSTDTEVILAAYAKWGEECVKRFNGMWSFAIFDAVSNKMFASRDPYGIKPFYYIDTPKQFVFGSEIKQLLPFLDTITAKKDVVENFLITGASDISNTTFFNSVTSLPAGKNLIYNLKDSTYRLYSYYILKHAPLAESWDVQEAADNIKSLLTDAVRIRLRSDVPVGTCLSGGLDSSIIATLAASEYKAGRFSGITAVSEQASNNEAKYAAQIAAASDLDWHQVCPLYQDFIATLPAIVRAQEEPFGGPSVTMQYMVMQKAKVAGIPVLLDGQGGDELFLGYERYYATYLYHQLRTQGLKNTLYETRMIRENNSRVRNKDLLRLIVGAFSSRARYSVYKYQHKYFDSFPPRPTHLKQLASAAREAWSIQALDVTSTNLPALLRFEDRNSMAHGIEARLPFLDTRVVETALSLPIGFKIRDGWTKWILRYSMQKTMPEPITWRKNKLGFEAPEKLWLDQHLPIMRSCVMRSELLDSLVQRNKLAKVFDGMNRRSQFRLYSLVLWEKEFGIIGIE